MTNNSFSTRPLQDFSGFNFFIDEYQRGYKWTAQQVIDLLDDINDFKCEEEAFYCLQPLAVKSLPEEKVQFFFQENFEKSYEVIDGQQRLTTLFLILKIIDGEIYRIQYQTREKSAEFLRDINNKIDNLSIEYHDDIKFINESITDAWKKYIKENSTFDNVDNYHFFSAYLTIKAWFDDKSDDFKKTYKKKILEDTRFIWYLDKSFDDAKSVFRNLNSGKIQLTNAELIKALFIDNLGDDNKEVLEMQKNTFAHEWDNIEQTLQNDDFWFFINNSTDKSKYQTRIDFIFELIVKKPKKSKDTLYSYRTYANPDGEPLDWEKVKRYFLKLKEWYDRPRWYHLIGYIIDRNFTTIQYLIDLSIGDGNTDEISKTDFENELYNIIRYKFTESNDDGSIKYNLDFINYNETPERIKNVLLLFNIEHYLKNIKGVRFPFKEFKHTKWSLEHIHAQNSDDIQTYEELEAFLNDVKFIHEETKKKHDSTTDQIEKETLNEKLNEYTKKIEPITNELLETLDSIVNKETLIADADRKLIEEVMPFVKEFLDMHKLSNMALIDQPTNSGLGKRPFPLKRDYLIEIDKKSWTTEQGKDAKNERPFIPPTTLNAFLKYYTKGKKQYEIWGYQDRTDYLNEIKATLEPYFKKTEVKA